MRKVILLLAVYLLSLAAGAPAHAAQAGDLDPTFSGDGQQTTDLGGDETGHSTAVQPDGKTVVVGDAYSSRAGFDFAGVRYNADGSLDRSFSGDGKATYEFKNATSTASEVALQGDKIVIVGQYEGPQSRGGDFLAMRLNADGPPTGASRATGGFWSISARTTSPTASRSAPRGRSSLPATPRTAPARATSRRRG